MARNNYERYHPHVITNEESFADCDETGSVTNSDLNKIEVSKNTIADTSDLEEETSDKKKNHHYTTVTDGVIGYVKGEFTAQPWNLASIFFTLYIIFLGWIFLQDNSLGRLIDWAGILIFVKKFVVITVVFGLSIIFVLCYSKRTKNTKKK
jgi:hypothetical protein